MVAMGLSAAPACSSPDSTGNSEAEPPDDVKAEAVELLAQAIYKRE
jgi:hypothetical protein